MCRHIFIDDGRAFPTRLFSLEKEFMTFLAVHSSRTHEPVSSQLSFFFLSFTIKVPTSKIWAMTQTRKEEILDRFDIFLLYKKKKLLMVQKSLWNNIPFPSFLRHENTNSTFLFFKRKNKKKCSFLSVFCRRTCNTMTPTRRSFHPLGGGGTCVMLQRALDTLSALRSFLFFFSKYQETKQGQTDVIPVATRQ